MKTHVSWKLAAALLLAATPMRSPGTDPSDLWNVDGQRRTRTCTPLKSATATLRFPDGIPTGFYAYADDPSRNGSAPDCDPGYAEMDAQEILYTGDGWDLYFHPGGGPDHYNDYVNKGQYGHIWVTDLAARPALQPQNLNGHACVTSNTPGLDANSALNLIGVAEDGAIYLGNLTASSVTAPEFRLYRWASEASPQMLVYEGDPGNGNPDIANWRWGDTLTVRGAGTNTQVLIASRGTVATVLTPTDATLTQFTATTLFTDVPAGGLGHGLSFGAGNTFWGKGASSNGLPLFCLGFDLNAGTAATLATWPTTNFPGRTGPLAVLPASNLLASIEMVAGADHVRLYDVSAASNPPVFLDREVFPTNVANDVFCGAVAFGSNRVYALDSDNGITAWVISPTSGSVPPAFFLDPTSLTVTAGSNVTLRAVADGIPAPQYQWFFNATNPIAGATNAILFLPNAQLTNAASYIVVASNAYGQATSAIAILSVTPPTGLIAFEPFAYDVGGQLAGQGGWVLNSGTSGTIQNGNLVVPGLAVAASNHFRWTSASMSVRLPVGLTSTGSIYCSFALRIRDVGTAASDTFAGFTIGTATTYPLKLNIASNSPGAYNLALYKSSGLTTGAVATNVFTTNDVVFIVGRLVLNTNSTTDDTCDLWVNPAPATFGVADPPPPTLGPIGAGRTDIAPIDRFFFRSAGPALECEADELRIGTTWASVTPRAVVPLGIEANGGTASLHWPTNFAGFKLEETASLTAPAWTIVTSTPATNGTEYVVYVAMTNASRFFRLRQ